MAKTEKPKSLNIRNGAVPDQTMTGATGTSVYGGYIQEDYLHTLRGKNLQDELAKLRRGDAQVAMVLRAVKNPIRRAKWFFDPSAPDDQGKRIRDFLDLVWFNSPAGFSFSKWVRESLTFLDCGFCIHEMGFRVAETREYGLVHILSEMGFRKQDTIEQWFIDRTGLHGVRQLVTGDTAGVEQRLGGSLDVRIDRSRLSILVNDQEGDNWEGVSVLRNAYGAWKRKQLYLKINAIGIEKSAVGTPVGKYPKGGKGDGFRDELAKVLQNFTTHENAYLLIPDQYTVEVFFNKYDAQSVLTSIQYEDSQIAKIMLMQFLELGQNGGGGAYALSKDQSALALDLLSFIAGQIAEEIDRISKMMIDWNFGVQDWYPKCQFSDISKRAGTELADLIQKYVAADVIQPDAELESFIRRTECLPAADPSTMRKKPPVSLPGKADPSDQDIEDDIEDDVKDAGDVGSTFAEMDPDEDDSMPTAPARELTEYEQGINFTEYASDFKSQTAGIEKTIQNRLALYAQKAVADLGKALKRVGSDRVKAADEVPLNFGQYKQALTAAFTDIAQDGWDKARSEMSMKMDRNLAESDAPSAKENKAALKFLPKHVASGVLKSAEAKVLQDEQSFSGMIAQAVTYGAETGMPDPDIQFYLEKLLDQYIQGRAVSAAGTFVSQNMNRGRNAWFFEPSNIENLQAFQYSAVIDSRTTPICLSLDKQIFKPNDPRAAELRPPNHWGCRSILVPITLNEKKPVITGLNPDPKNPELVAEYRSRGKTPPDMAKIQKSRNL